MFSFSARFACLATHALLVCVCTYRGTSLETLLFLHRTFVLSSSSSLLSTLESIKFKSHATNACYAVYYACGFWDCVVHRSYAVKEGSHRGQVLTVSCMSDDFGC